MPDTDTICPSCEAAGGDLGAACTNPVCSKMGYHFIPVRSFHKHRSRALSSGARPDPLVGRMVVRYLVIEKLGEGGMGAVYLALQLPVKKEVALKMIAGLQLDDDARKRFEREATAISRLYHPNIVSLVDYGTDPETGAPFMAIEHVRGGRELADLMEARRMEGRPWTPEELINIFTQILNGLAVAHREGLVHRDIKPQNIMLVAVEGNPHFVYLLDFGLAKAFEEVPGFETLTAGGAVIGTPQYMAPEQIASRGEVDFRCDLYAVGAVFFEMITGRPCCGGHSTKEIFFEKLNPDFDPLDTLPPGSLTPAMTSFLTKATAREPSQRFEGAGAMRKALVETLGGTVEAGGAGEEAAAGGPTVAVDSRKLLEGAGEPKGSTGATLDVRSVPGSRVSRGRPSSGRWMLLAGAVGLAAAAAVAFFLGPWSPLAREADEAVPEKPAAEAPGPEPASPGPEPVSPGPEPVSPGPEPAASGKEVVVTGPEPEAADEAARVPEPEPRGKSEKKKKKLPEKPSDEEVERERKKLEKSLVACAQDIVSGTLKGTVNISGKTGKPYGYTMQGKINDYEHRPCLRAAIYEMEFQPFSETKAHVNFSIAVDRSQEESVPASGKEESEAQAGGPAPNVEGTEAQEGE